MVNDTEICLLGNLFGADICDLENIAFLKRSAQTGNNVYYAQAAGKGCFLQ